MRPHAAQMHQQALVAADHVLWNMMPHVEVHQSHVQAFSEVAGASYEMTKQPTLTACRRRHDKHVTCFP